MPRSAACCKMRRPEPSSPTAERRTTGSPSRARFSAIFLPTPPTLTRMEPGVDVPAWIVWSARPLVSMLAAPIMRRCCIILSWLSSEHNDGPSRQPAIPPHLCHPSSRAIQTEQEAPILYHSLAQLQIASLWALADERASGPTVTRGNPSGRSLPQTRARSSCLAPGRVPVARTIPERPSVSWPLRALSCPVSPAIAVGRRKA